MKTKISFILLFLYFCSTTLFAQKNSRSKEMAENSKYSLVGFNAGIAYYSGEYANQAGGEMSFSNPEPSFTVYGQTKISKRWHIKVQASYLKISSKDKRDGSPNYDRKAFSSNIIDLSPMLVFDIGTGKKGKGSVYSKKKVKVLNWYLMMGTGLFYADVSNFVGGSSASRVGGSITFGTGLRKAISEKWVLNAEALLRLSSSDQLDGTPNSAIPADLYMTVQIGAAYRIQGRDKN